jgi:hypothetical protein
LLGIGTSILEAMVRFIILIVILILALSYFGVSIRDIAQSPTGEDNFSFVWNYVKDGWEIITEVIAVLIESVRNVFS